MSEFVLRIGEVPSPSVREVRVREALSAPFCVDVTFRIGDASLDLDSIVGRPARLLHVGGGLGWTGIVTRMALLRVEVDGLSTYVATIEPALGLLGRTLGRRIHRRAPSARGAPAATSSSLDFALGVLVEWSIPHRVEATPHLPDREMRVQHDESALELFHRLLDETFVSYAFELSSDQRGDPQSELVLSDAWHRADPLFDSPLPVTEGLGVAGRATIRDLRFERTLRPGKLTMTSTGKRSRLSGVSTAGTATERALEQHLLLPAGFDVYRDGDIGPSVDEGENTAGRLLATARDERVRVRFETRALELAPGSVVTIDSPALGAGRRLIVLCRTIREVYGAAPVAEIVAADAAAPPRPIRAVRPRQGGFETATVVGPPGETIFTDALGRVRLRFPWDRSPGWERTPWVPVAPMAAGPLFGGSHIPRIGNRVVVTFEDGDPDRPVVVGRLFTNPRSLPVALPAGATTTTWKTAGTAGHGNELSFEDEAGRERLALVAQRKLRKLVRGDEVERVGKDRYDQVRGHRAAVIGGQDKVVAGDTFRVVVSGAGGEQLATRVEMTEGRIEIATAGGTIVLDGPDIEITAVGDVRVGSKADLDIRGGPHVRLNAPPGPINPDFELQGGSIDDALGKAGINADSGTVSAILPAKKLYESRYATVSTKEDTRVSASLSRDCFLDDQMSECLDISAHPGISISTPVHDIDVQRIVYDFTRGRVARVEAGGAPDWAARMAVDKTVRDLLKDSEMGRPGYSPFSDPDLLAKLRALMPETTEPSEPIFSPSEIKDPSASARISLKEPVKTEWITVLANQDIHATVQTKGSVQDLLDKDPKLRLASVTTNALKLEHEGTDYGRVTMVSVGPTGNPDDPVKVGIHGIDPAGPLATAYGAESVLRLGALALAVVSGASRLSDGRLEPTVVDHVVKRKAEQIASEALKPLLFENRDAVPGLDLVRVFGAEPAD